MWTKLHKANLGKDPDFVSVAKPVFSVHSELAGKSSSVRKEKKQKSKSCSLSRSLFDWL